MEKNPGEKTMQITFKNLNVPTVLIAILQTRRENIHTIKSKGKQNPRHTAIEQNSSSDTFTL